jgi:hypothetical protein
VYEICGQASGLRGRADLPADPVDGAPLGAALGRAVTGGASARWPEPDTTFEQAAAVSDTVSETAARPAARRQRMRRSYHPTLGKR